ncbi:tRNA dihydrouridine synthase DusB [Bradymonadaceae bacterium TMQ3]|uniref:tRNA-dihydrouridine synthase n=1 Tax=Lujinxingia sediminis TaxID=2480984 RepID=A0ABY0CVZ2_9DELT|nr:tRNA dihydrouridine synthase DusB [Lujinxingia sediminis]RDV37264.1 tRNA dihydrouridine synthase DusB [Bradymonadaceae bacterium TMQ3]RVU46789.1 tRNA dihydrouridine synthase DusB [Lujinxingia sediminis]TXC74799.1 tRNA dihydrouridine synthase DusB [Bradymonadales bacterium TMQ1]
MGIPFEKLTPKRWGGEVPGPVERPPLDLGHGVVLDPPVVLSPMAAVTSSPFRRVCRDMGAGMVATEMVSAVGLIHRAPMAVSMVDLVEGESPVCVQIYGKRPEELARAAQIAVELGADVVDLNMGCPMKKVVSSGHGAALLRDVGRVQEIFSAMSEAVDVPVTGKMRAGWEDTSAVEVARAMEAGGAAALTIHGRTRSAMYDGHADLSVIAAVKEAVGIPVIGNGDVCDWVSARRMFSATGCDAVMVARGALGNPWVFREIAADLRGEPIPEPPSPELKRATLLRHVDLYLERFGEGRTCKEIRKHLLWYYRGTPGELVLRKRLSDLTSAEDIRQAIDAALAANVGQTELGAKSHPRASRPPQTKASGVVRDSR